MTQHRPAHRWSLLFVLVATLCTVAACSNSTGGSSSSSSSGTGTSSTSSALGHVSLPPGSRVSPGSLSVSTVFGTAAVGLDGTFIVPTGGAGPTLVLVTMPRGELVLVGTVDAADGNAGTITVASSAEAALFFAIGGPSLPPEVWPALRKVIAAHPASRQLAAAIQSRMATSPTALGESDPQVAAALQEGANLLLFGNSSGQLATALTPARSPEHARRRLRATDANPTNIQPEPNADQSGVGLVVGDGTITLQNKFRRDVGFFVFRTGFTDSQDRTVTLPAPQVLVEKVFIQGTTGASGLITLLQNFAENLGKNSAANEGITGLFKGPLITVFDAQSIDPQSLPLDPADAKSTQYRVDIVGLGKLQSSGKDLTADELAFQELIQLLDAVKLVSALLGVVGDDLGLGATPKDVLDVLVNFSNIVTANVPVVPEALKKGDLGLAASKLLEAVLGQSQVHDGFLDLFDRLATKLNKPADFGRLAKGLDALRKFQGIGKAVDKALAANDLRLQLDELEKCSTADSWSVKVSPTALNVKVTVTPAAATVTPKDTGRFVTFTAGATGAQLQNLGPGQLTFHWNVTGALGGDLSDNCNHKSLKDFDSTCATVSYTAPSNGTDKATDKVSVSAAFVKEGGLSKVQLGSAVPAVVTEDNPPLLPCTSGNLIVGPDTPGTGGVFFPTGIVSGLNAPASATPSSLKIGDTITISLSAGVSFGNPASGGVGMSGLTGTFSNPTGIVKIDGSGNVTYAGTCCTTTSGTVQLKVTGLTGSNCPTVSFGTQNVLSASLGGPWVVITGSRFFSALPLQVN